MKTLCRCGCGGPVTAGRRFVAGHNMRGEAPGAAVRAGKRLWTAAEDAKMRALFPDTKTEDLARVIGRTYSSTCQRARKLGLKKSAAYLASPAACRLRRGDKVGAPYRFPKGHVPKNKGLRRPGWGPGRMKDTQFKKGTCLGAAQRNYQPVGSERISKDGYLERKTHDALPDGLSRTEANRLRQRRWRAVHLIVWEAAHGPVPDGHAIVFANGDKRDIRLDNLQCISRVELMQRNTIHNLPKPLARTVQLLGALNRQIRKREKAHA